MQNKKHYKSLGQMLKAGDFESLLDDLQAMKKSGELKNFSKTTSQNPISEFDDLLFFFPQYAVKTIKNKDGTIEKTGELYPKAMDFLKFCLENGANPNAYMKNGENTYLKACEINNTEILDYLINNPYNPIDLTHADGMGNTGLFYATMAEAIDILDYLVKKCNFNVNEKNFLSNNQTVLHYACGHGKEKSFDKLIELGANPTLKDNYGFEPVDMILPAYDEEVREEYANNPEELIFWDRFYQKVKYVTEKYRAENKPKLKTKF